MRAPGRFRVATPSFLTSRLDRFRSDQHGAVAVMAAGLLTVMMGFAAFGIDVGKVFADRRAAQSAADLAAIAAASDLARANRAAVATVRQNSYPAEALTELVTGTYKPDPALAADRRFTPAPLDRANAAQVKLRTATPLIFGKLLTGQDHFIIETRATAARTAFASFAIGSGLVRLEGGLLNAMLGSLLGTSLSLSVMDYRSLLDTRLDLFSFSRALASRARLTAGTYDSIAAAEVGIADIVGAMLDTAQAGGHQQAALALTSILNAVRHSPTRTRLSSLIDFGPHAGSRTSETPQMGLSVAALDFLSAVAQLANGQRQAAVSLGAGFPGLLDVTLSLAIGERPQGRRWIAIGEAGTSVHTAQTRLLLIARIAGTGPVTLVTLPIYLELAAATGTLQEVSCAPSGHQAVVAVTPAVLDGWIGNVGAAEFTNFTTAPRPGKARLAGLPLLAEIKGRAHATITNLASRSLVFSAQDIAQHTKKSVSTGDFTSSLLSKLIGDLDVEVEVLGLGIGLPGGLSQTVAQIVAAAALPLDRALSDILSTLGISLGQADVWVTGIRCDGAVLVH
ncbi:MAG TPA: pilus assembly protein TadG-related protein [Xanthobacteraceae bacterium]|nr:pilus assembly protein TadG-related protein [Xanthobacteraceae bacterium]